MKNKMIIKTTLLIGLALCISFIQIHVLRSKYERGTVAFPYALERLEMGSPIEGDQIGWIYLEENKAIGVPLTKDEIEGKYLNNEIEKGQVIYASGLLSQSFIIPKGYRAFSIKVSSDNLCNLFIEPNMEVDVCFTDSENLYFLESLKVLDVMKEANAGSLVSVLLLGTKEQAIQISTNEKQAKIEVLMKPQIFAVEEDK